jgi:hypothetical protein
MQTTIIDRHLESPTSVSWFSRYDDRIKSILSQFEAMQGYQNLPPLTYVTQSLLRKLLLRTRASHTETDIWKLAYSGNTNSEMTSGSSVLCPEAEARLATIDSYRYCLIE